MSTSTRPPPKAKRPVLTPHGPFALQGDRVAGLEVEERGMSGGGVRKDSNGV